MTSPTARTLLRALGGAVVAFAVLGGMELGLRMIGVPDPGLYAGDPSSLWWLRSNLDTLRVGPEPGSSFGVRTNSLGLRGPLPPPEGPWTLALGCSTTFGWGVEEHEAWPAVLAGLLDEEVVNGGQPGWSSHQAVAVAPRWLELGPSRVILSFIVRDAQPASRPDHEAVSASWIWRSQLGRGMQALLLAGAGPARPASGGPRVPPERFAENLRTLVREAGDAEVVLLAFPQLRPSQPHLEAMERVGPPVLTPQLSAADFFPSDPVHLDADGHRRLAEEVASALR